MSDDFEGAVNLDQMDDDDIEGLVRQKVEEDEDFDAADTARVEDAAVDAPMGEPGKATTDTAEHLLPDDEGDMDGTHDLQKAIERGQSYSPPDGPVQEGAGEGEQH